MSFVTKLITASARCLWQSASARRGFHILNKPLTTVGSLPAVASTPVAATGLITCNEFQRLLAPSNTLLTQVAGFKVKGRLKRRCKDCYIVVRQERSYVICPTHPRHKQMAMKKRDYKSWILTHATQSKVRGY